MLPLATNFRTYVQNITGTPTQLAFPLSDQEPAEFLLVGTQDFLVQSNLADTAFPVTGGTPIRLPSQQAPIYISGIAGGQVNYIVLGYNNKYGK